MDGIEKGGSDLMEMNNQRAIDILQNANLGGVLRQAADYAVELLEAEKQGWLVVLPCKVGDKLYDKSGKVAEVEEFWVDKRNVSAQVHFQCDYDCNECAFNSWHTEYSGENSCDGEYGCAIVPVDELGKSVFLTREEAEAALRGRKEDG